MIRWRTDAWGIRHRYVTPGNQPLISLTAIAQQDEQIDAIARLTTLVQPVTAAQRERVLLIVQELRQRARRWAPRTE